MKYLVFTMRMRDGSPTWVKNGPFDANSPEEAAQAYAAKIGMSRENDVVVVDESEWQKMKITPNTTYEVS